MAVSRKKSYIICAPAYSGSAGIRVLYKLRDELEKRGFDAKIFCYEAEGKRNRNKKINIFALSDENRDNDIVIYPDVVIGNPLLCRNVVRFLLNKPGALGGESEFHPGETLFSFDRFCHPTAPMLRFDMIDRNLFFDAHAPKNVNCYFVHKRGKFRELPELKDCVEINKNYPATREELAALLQRTDTVYSYDDNSCLLQEAVLCGAKVKIITQDGMTDYQLNDEYDAAAFEAQINYFIELTQALNYTGPINRKGYYPLTEFFKRYLKRRAWGILYLLTHAQKFKRKIHHIKNTAPRVYGGKYVL